MTDKEFPIDDPTCSAFKQYCISNLLDHNITIVKTDQWKYFTAFGHEISPEFVFFQKSILQKLFTTSNVYLNPSIYPYHLSCTGSHGRPGAYTRKLGQGTVHPGWAANPFQGTSAHAHTLNHTLKAISKPGYTTQL